MGRVATELGTTPHHYDVLVRDIDGGSARRVNPAGENGANGDIVGNVLVYQEFEERRSCIRFFDLETGERSDPPQGVNTKHWEYWPTMTRPEAAVRPSRAAGPCAARGPVRPLVRRGDGAREGPRAARVPRTGSGQRRLGGLVAVRRPVRVVVRYEISTGERELIDGPNGEDHHSPSVGARGTVFHARGGDRCGDRVRLVREPLEGREKVLWRLPNGDDIGRTHVQTRPHGTTVLFDHFGCGRPSNRTRGSSSFGDRRQRHSTVPATACFSPGSGPPSAYRSRPRTPAPPCRGSGTGTPRRSDRPGRRS